MIHAIIEVDIQTGILLLRRNRSETRPNVASVVVIMPENSALVPSACVPAAAPLGPAADALEPTGDSVPHPRTKRATLAIAIETRFDALRVVDDVSD
ncbi:MAG: hypothetical protein ABIT38_08250 [Gemmatimonadaceae bacterium]